MVAQSQGVNPVALVLSNMLMARTNRPDVRVGVLRRQLLQQRLRFPQSERVEPFSELAPRDWLWPRSLIVPTAITGPVSAVA